MRYQQASRYLYALAPRGVLLGLDRMHEALAQRGHPERAYRTVLVAGTNGKGSVAAMLASVLRASGLKVGLYTSPHLHRLVERFQIDGRPVGEAELARRVTALAPWLEASSTPPLTFFEVCTLLAFEIFRDRRCDVVILEVGLGGRLDATNVVTPELSVITRIALDHADRLGPTLAHIAREKAGIVKRGVPVVSGVREPQALRVIKGRARRQGAPLWQIDHDFRAGASEGGRWVQVGPERHERLALPLRGAYQADNLACAVAALSVLRSRGFEISEAALRRGIKRVVWPGRLELLSGRPDVLLDAAHNPDACVALAQHLRELRAKYRRVVLLFGVMRDKAYEPMLDLLLPEVDEAVFATPDTPRALPAAELEKRVGGTAIDEPLRALRAARQRAGTRGLVVAAGSIFLMAAVRAKQLGLRNDPPIAM
jgi:dihydrofolate synthase/folylpolyglutamate synthase